MACARQQIRNLDLRGICSLLNFNLDSEPGLLKLNVYANHLGTLLKYRFKFIQSGGGLTVSTSDKLPGRTNDAGPQALP